MMGPGAGGPPVMVLNTKQQRQTGRQAQLNNISAARSVASIIRTTLGPRSMLKMLLDPMGSIVLTNDGHCILREVDVSHPVAKSMIELSRTQDEEVGDGTTSVILLAAEVLSAAEIYLRADNSSGTAAGGTSLSSSMSLHPTVIVRAYSRALSVALDILESLTVHVELTAESELLQQLVKSALSTKFSRRWNDLMVQMAVQAVLTVASDQSPSTTSTTADANNIEQSNNVNKSTSKVLSLAEVDLKRYAKIEKIPGGEMEDCAVLSGVMFQKEPVHPGMPRRLVNPKILLLDTPLEYKKGESQTNMEISNDSDWNALLQLEEEYVANQCAQIIAAGPDIVITEKGVSDLAQHYLKKAGIVAFRRLRKTDNNRIARAVGATIVSRTDEIQPSDLGTACGLYEMRKVGQDWFCYLTDCDSPKACTIVLRGGSKDVLNEIERNLQDAMQVVRNVVYHPKLVCGGGATEMALSVGLQRYAAMNVPGVEQGPFSAVGEAFEVIPKTLAQNCGVNVIRTITQLRAKHAAAYDDMDKVKIEEEKGESKVVTPSCTWGINGETGAIVDMRELGVYEPFTVKAQTLKTAIESACMILRIDDIVSGSKKR